MNAVMLAHFGFHFGRCGGGDLAVVIVVVVIMALLGAVMFCNSRD
jgi:hypothetical protein